MSKVDVAIRRLALRQYGVFTAVQALERGASYELIRRRLESGMWEQAVPGVYRLLGAPATWRQRLMVALLMAGDGAAVSHRSAAALWGLPGFAERPIEVLAPHGVKNHRYRKGLVGVFHESRRLPDDHVRVREGLAVTAIERTLCDLAGELRSWRQTERATDNALALGLTVPERLWRTWGDLGTRGRRGSRLMRAILDVRVPGYVAPATELEARYCELCAAAGYPVPVRQLQAGGEEMIGRVDMSFKPIPVIVELDGTVGHTSLLDRAEDRRRDNELFAAGWRAVLRFTWDEIVTRGPWVQDVTGRTLRAHGAA